MTESDLLFSFLRFVALVAPAIAILMQLLSNNVNQSSFPFRLLEASLISIFMGGLIILYNLSVLIEGIYIQIGSFLIFMSLLFAAAAIGWNATSMSQKFAEVTGTSPGFRAVLSQLFYILIALIPAFIIFYLSSFIFIKYIEGIVNIGPIRNMDSITPIVAFIAANLLLAVRVSQLLVEKDSIPVRDLEKSFTNSMAYSGSLVIAFYLVAIFPIIIFRVVLYVPSSYVGFSKESVIFILPYLWAGIVLAAIFAADIDDDNDEEDPNA